MDPNVITTIAGVVVIIVAAWRISGQINALSGDIRALSARVDGVEARLGNLERDVHAINEHLRRRPE